MARNATDDVNTLESVEEGRQNNPLVRLFGDHSKARILSVLLSADEPLNPSRITECASMSHGSWYNVKDELLESGLVIQTGHAGNSPLYAVPDDDPRVDALRLVEDLTGAAFRDGEVPDVDIDIVTR